MVFEIDTDWVATRDVSGIGGIIHGPLPPRVADNKAMVFTFSREGFFGYASSGPASANSLMWWSSFENRLSPVERDEA